MGRLGWRRVFRKRCSFSWCRFEGPTFQSHPGPVRDGVFEFHWSFCFLVWICWSAGITLLLRGSISDKASLCDKWPRIPARLDNILLFLFTHLSLLRRSTSLPTNSDQLPWTDFGKEFMLHAKAAKQAQTITPPLPCPTLGGRGGCFLKGFWIFLMFTLITRVHRVEQNWMSLLVLSVRLNPSSHQSWKQQISIGVGDYGYQSDTKLDRASFTNAHSFTVNVMIMQ